MTAFKPKLMRGVFVLLGLWLQQSIACEQSMGPVPGGCAPEMTLKDLDGKLHKISFDSNATKVYLIHFWATWCQPCAEEIPSLEALYDKLDKNKVSLITVSIDEDGQPALNRFFKNIFSGKKPNFPIVLDSDRSLFSKFKLKTAQGEYKVPETFIISQDGTILDKVIGKRVWGDDPIIVSYLNLLSKS